MIRKPSIVLTTGFAVLLAGAVLVPLSGATASDADAAQRNPNDEQTRRVCRIITPTGSRLTKRVCRTQAEWDRVMRKTQDELLDRSVNESRNWDARVQ